MRVITVDIVRCSACGSNHDQVKIKTTILHTCNFIGKCPTTNKTLFIKHGKV